MQVCLKTVTRGRLEEPKRNKAPPKSGKPEKGAIKGGEGEHRQSAGLEAGGSGGEGGCGTAPHPLRPPVLGRCQANPWRFLPRVFSCVAAAGGTALPCAGCLPRTVHEGRMSQPRGWRGVGGEVFGMEVCASCPLHTPGL